MKKMLFFGLGLISLVVLNVFGVPYLFDGVQTNEGGDTLATLTGLRSSTLTTTDPELPSYDLAVKFWLHEVKDGQLGAEIGDPNQYNSPEWDFGNVKQVTEFNSDADSVAFVVQITALDLLDTTKLLGLAKAAYDASNDAYALWKGGNDTASGWKNAWNKAETLWKSVETKAGSDEAIIKAITEANTEANKTSGFGGEEIPDAAQTAWKDIQGLGFTISNAPTLTVVHTNSENSQELKPYGGFAYTANSTTTYSFLEAKSKNNLKGVQADGSGNLTGGNLSTWGIVSRDNEDNVFGIYKDFPTYVVSPGWLEDNFPAFYAIYFVKASDVANINLRVGVKWKGKDSYYGDADNRKRVNITPATRGDSTTFTFELSKSDKLAEINTLDELHLVVLNSNTNPSENYNQDLGDDLLSGFSKDVFDYTARPTELESEPYLYFKPSRTGVKIKVEYNGAGVIDNTLTGKDTTFFSIATSWAYVKLPTLGGDIKVTVTSANGVSSKIYKLSYKQLLNEAPDLITIGTDKVQAHLLEYLYVKYGSDTIKIYREDGTIFDGTIRSQEADNVFIASVPDPNNSDVSILSKYWSRWEYDATVKDKIKIVWKKNISSQGDVSLTVDLLKPDVDGGTTYSPGRPYKLQPIDNISSIDSVSVSYTINLRSNVSTLEGLTFRYDSITAPNVNINYNEDSLEYKGITLPDNLKRLYVYAKPNDSKAKVEVKLSSKGPSFEFEPITTINGVAYPNWWRLKSNNTLSIDTLKEGFNYLTVHVQSQDDLSSRTYSVQLKRLYDLNLRSLDVKLNGESLFSEDNNHDPETLKKVFTFNVSLPDNFVKEDLTNLEVVKEHPNTTLVSTAYYVEAVGDDYRVVITVKAPDQVKYYYVNLRTSKAITTFKSLLFSTGKLEPAFSPDIREYDLIISDSTEVVEFYGFTTDDLATSNTPKTLTVEEDYTLVTLEVLASNKTTKGEYLIHVKKESYKGEEGGETGISKVSNSSNVSYSNNILTVSNSSNERVYVLSTLGQLITTFDKSSGSISIPFNQKGIFILNGSSGWVSKILVK